MDHVVEFPALEQFPQRFEHDPGVVVVVVVVVVVLGVVVVAGGGVFLLEYLARSHPSPSVTLFRFHGALFAFPIAAFYADDAEEGNPVVVLVDDAFARVEDPVHPAVGFLRGRRPRRLLWQAQTRFFEQLARRAVEGVFAPFQSAAGKGPLSGAVTAFSPTDEKLAVFGEQDDADADPRVHNISSSSSRAVSRLARVAFVSFARPKEPFVIDRFFFF